jgi:thioesterase domain-containing protein
MRPAPPSPLTPTDPALQPAELEQYLHRHIPLSRAMAVTVESVSPLSVVLRAPLPPNINHHDTVFGGSAASVALLAGWSLLHVRLRAPGLASRLVIQRHSMEHERPIDGAFTARAQLDESDCWEPFLKMLSRRGKARVTVSTLLEQSGERVGRLVGEFVALRVAER